MNDVHAILSIANEAVDHVEESDDWGEHDWISLKFLADYYRTHIDNNKELYTAELPEYVGQYLVTDAHMELMDYPEEQDLPFYIVRDMLRFYREWAFLHGYRNGTPDEATLDLTGYKDDHTRSLLEAMNQRIEAGEASPQSVFAGLKLAHLAFDKSRDAWAFDDTTSALASIEDVSEIVSDIVERARANENMPFDYNKVAGTLDFTYNELHHKGLEHSAQRQLARQIRDGETTAEEFLDNS